MARAHEQEIVELEHLLCALCDDPGVAALLAGAGVDAAALRRRSELALRDLPRVPGASVYLGERVLRLLDVAESDASDASAGAGITGGVGTAGGAALAGTAGSVGTTGNVGPAHGDTARLVDPLHLLVGLPLAPETAAASVLREQGLGLPRLEELVAAARRARVARVARTNGSTGAEVPGAGNDASGGASGSRVGDAGTNPSGDPLGDLPILRRYARDLVALARAGKLDPVQGRDAEIRRVTQILGRRSKNNPILIGDPGVGKTAIVEGLAQRLAEGDVPSTLAGKRLFALDVGALVAGAKFRGEFEERVRGVVTEVRETGGEVLLFFDEIHTLVGAGKGDGSLDAAELLKPPLARGEITCLGATTPSEYRLHIEKDAAFERRFQPVPVDEPGDDACLAMLRGAKGRYEQRHRVRIEDAALQAAVKLSRRYVAGRALPDKALDLVDEAASRLRLELDSLPDELDGLHRRERSLAVEIEALGREREPAAAQAKAERERELVKLRSELGPLRERWQAELGAVTAVGQADAAVEQARTVAAAAERLGDLGKAAEIRYGSLPALERALAEAEQRLQGAQGAAPLLEAAVAPVHVARVVADWTHIPVNRMLEAERQKILAIEERLRGRVIGQDDAVAVIGHAIKRARAGLADPGKPIGSFLFLGPTGVGKTELTKALAEFLFDDEHALVRLDMAEYMEKHAVARLAGAPPGYVGYEEGGQLTEAVRRRPFSVVLFDEVEKAHPDVFNVLLALLDDGRLTDSQGRTVSFANTVVILTSNLGSHEILEGAGDRVAIKAAVTAALRGHFRPELLNRIDETVIFNPLGRREVEAIVDLQFKRLRKLLAEQDIGLELDPEARALLAEESYDPAFGARPVKRCLQRRLRDPLSELVLAGTIRPGQVVHVRRGQEAGALRFDAVPA